MNDTTSYNDNNVTNNANKGRGLFYAVIAVATFIVMAVGATFAYFTATTQSTNSSVQTGSTTLQLKYISYQAAWMNNDLIPADTAVVEYSFENQNDVTMQTNAETGEPVDELSNAMCKDDYGNSICSVYVFQVTNSANSPQSVSISIVSETNGFSSLNAMAYELTLGDDTTAYNSTDNNNGFNDPAFTGIGSGDTIDVVDSNGALLSTDDFTPIYVNRSGVTKTLLTYTSDSGDVTTVASSIDRLLVPITDLNMYSDTSERSTTVADDITIDGSETRTFAIVLYIKNESYDQTSTDADKTFSGQVVVGSGDGTTGVSGTISAYAEGSVQSEAEEDNGAEGD